MIEEACESYHNQRAAILRKLDDAKNAEAAEQLRRELEALDAAWEEFNRQV